MRGWRRLFWVAVLIALGLVLVTDVPAAYVLGPLIGLGILRVGLASFQSMAPSTAPRADGGPEPLDPRQEHVIYTCRACEAELLLLLRGADVPPRHCGERMAERHELPRDIDQ